MLALYGVEASLLNPFVYRRIALVKGDHQRGDRAELIKPCNLLWSCGAPIKDPSVYLAIRLVQSSLHQVYDQFIRDYLKLENRYYMACSSQGAASFRWLLLHWVLSESCP